MENNIRTVIALQVMLTVMCVLILVASLYSAYVLYQAVDALRQLGEAWNGMRVGS